MATMMVPKVYQGFAATMQSRSPSPNERRRRQQTASPAAAQNKASNTPPANPKRPEIISAATTSQPVIIPTRSQQGKSRRAKTSVCPEKVENDVPGHDPTAISPSMAALLAITSIPSPRSTSLRERRREKYNELGSLRMEDFRRSLSSSSPKSWSILQSGPEDDDTETEKSADIDNENWSVTSSSPGQRALSPFLSLSSDSMPSLETDADHDSQNSLSPPTPASRLRGSQGNRRDRLPSPAIPIVVETEHPLATSSFPGSSPDTTPPLTPTTFDPISKRRPPSAKDKPQKSFTSNLTASLRLLKNAAAKTLSSSTRLPDPNTLTISSTHLSFPPSPPPLSPESPSSSSFLRSANIDALPLHLSAPLLPIPPSTMSIQLQSYVASPLSTPTATAPPIFSPPARPSTDSYEKKQQRELRENADFLRVVVLEMNMRRAGKLSGEGRARIWLGARQESRATKSNESQDKRSGEYDEGDSSVEDDKRKRNHEEEKPRARPGIADGAQGHGVVTLDGEVGEAQEVEADTEALREGGTGVVRKRATPKVPRRWVALEV